MANKPNFIYKKVSNELRVVLIEDVGPWDQHPTVTNRPEMVVSEVLKKYPWTCLLFYVDSGGCLDELRIRNNKFDGFAPGPKADMATKVGKFLYEPIS